MSDFLNPPPPPRAQLRAAMQQRMVIAPGAYDAISARLIEQSGAQACYLTGFGVTASLLGQPDIGLTTQSEMVDAVRRVCDVTNIPVIADADTGFGNTLNVVRTVRAYEQAGASAIQLEDQVVPKRCGHMSGKEVIGLTDAVAKIRAAVATRTDPDFQIVARTDVAAVEGIDVAIDRAKAFADAGADILFVEAPRSRADIEKVADALSEHRLLFNWVEGGKTEGMDISLIRDLGYRIVIFPISTLLAATAAVRNLLTCLQATGSTDEFRDRMATFEEVTTLVGLDQVREIEASFSPQ